MCFSLVLSDVPSVVAGESFLYAANLCQRSIAGFRIEKDGLLSRLPESPLPSVTYQLIANPVAPYLYAANISSFRHETRAYRVVSGGFLQEINTLDQLPAYLTGVAMHPQGRALYRASAPGNNYYSLEFFDFCITASVSDPKRRYGLASVPIGEDGGLGKPQQIDYYTNGALVVDPAGEFLFAGQEGKVQTFQLDKDGLITFPPLHSFEGHYATPMAMRVLTLDKQRYLFVVDGDGSIGFGISIFRINANGSLDLVREAIDIGYDVREFTSLPLKNGEIVLYFANYGGPDPKPEPGSNNVTVLRVSNDASIVLLQTLPMPPHLGNPFHRRPGGLVATPTHLYVTNFNSPQEIGMGPGSVLVFAINKDGTINPELLQEIDSGGNGTASPVVVHRK